ncbi:arsenate reductase (glutaredoxin) [Stenotrophomonas sp. MMGLT7]|uniref:arsenate reductase (glutaredoxin) n=1 Tax=Stenotrophomonas sp. MMGLT7 TaxID=2901227 RepID=UPI001E3DBF58|nr:arsenate reductase (glutaredoxin) [Stenotrophomonas sp. MMGLT7]MCD7098761.1 arsenate reductase (glutaredoxin) [Stenotrophomonas sp. MMGLT7]
MADAAVVIWHNPRCGSSRKALELIRQAGIEPEIVEYLKTPPAPATLRALVARMGIATRELLRSKEAVHAELGLDDPALDEEALVAAMVAHPILINRPVVQTPRGAALCRPPEKVLELLP